MRMSLFTELAEALSAEADGQFYSSSHHRKAEEEEQEEEEKKSVTDEIRATLCNQPRVESA